MTKFIHSDIVSTMSLVRSNWRQSRQLVAVDIVAKLEHVQLGRLCRKPVLSQVDKIDRVEFDFIVSVYLPTVSWLPPSSDGSDMTVYICACDV